MKIVVTGGAGFIGSNFLNLMVPQYPIHLFINLDKLTYAANPYGLKEVEKLPNYTLEQGDIVDPNIVMSVFRRYDPDLIIHFAAESHVDRSILQPSDFIQTNILGTFHLLEACRATWKKKVGRIFHHVSTDEVYGSLGGNGCFTEETKYDPSSPYSASKAASDHMVRSYYKTYGLPVKITNCSNNYGPRQFPEKLIPLMILNGLAGKPLPIYGDGCNIRDWLYVEDHCEGILKVLQEGRPGEKYNIGGNTERTNLQIIDSLCSTLERLRPANDNPALRSRGVKQYSDLKAFVEDRPGHDRRYAIDSRKISSKGC